MGAPKLEKFPVQLLGLDSIKVDHAIQSRVATSMEYQREFSEAMLRGDTFPPITVFFDGKLYWLADGFHRYGAAKQASRVERKFEGIRAEIRPGTRRDAIVFSAGANQRFSIPRTSEDVKKSVMMILDDVEWFNKSNLLLSKYVGCSPCIIARHRLEYCNRKGIEIPDKLVGSDGRSCPSARDSHGFPRMRHSRGTKGKGEFRANFQGKTLCLGGDEKEAEQRLRERVSDVERRSVSLRSNPLISFFVRKGLLFHSLNLHHSSFCGIGSVFQGHGIVWVVAQFSRSSSGMMSDRVPEAVGRVLLGRHHADPSSRAVVLCHVEDAPPAMLDLARQLGVEFLTPEELVESIKGNEQEP